MGTIDLLMHLRKAFTLVEYCLKIVFISFFFICFSHNVNAITSFHVESESICKVLTIKPTIVPVNMVHNLVYVQSRLRGCSCSNVALANLGVREKVHHNIASKTVAKKKDLSLLMLIDNVQQRFLEGDQVI